MLQLALTGLATTAVLMAEMTNRNIPLNQPSRAPLPTESFCPVRFSYKTTAKNPLAIRHGNTSACTIIPSTVIATSAKNPGESFRNF